MSLDFRKCAWHSPQYNTYHLCSLVPHFLSRHYFTTGGSGGHQCDLFRRLWQCQSPIKRSRIIEISDHSRNVFWFSAGKLTDRFCELTGVIDFIATGGGDRGATHVPYHILKQKSVLLQKSTIYSKSLLLFLFNRFLASVILSKITILQ